MNKSFEEVLEYVEARLEMEWKDTPETEKPKLLEKQKRAILGYEEDMNFFKERIEAILTEAKAMDSEYPDWYLSLTEGVFDELYGLAGLSPWVYDEKEKYRTSSSAKLIGDNLFCLIDGKSELQPQKISKKRREQLKRTFLMSAPRERLEKGFHEVYLKNGIRVTIFSGERTKSGQDIMVFRKYLLKEFSFEKLSELGTIPYEAVPLFKSMIKIGFNVLFTGPVRSGKTTFLQTWQSYEDPTLEGLTIATDPETPWEKIMPNVPIMQLVCDGADLENITKSILRGDNDYILLEEMRDEVAFKVGLEVTATGTQRSKATVHSQDPVNLPYRMATRIRGRYGGDLQGLILQFFRSFNYALEFCQVESDRSKKKLKAMYEYCYDIEKDEISVHKIIAYDPVTDTWRWNAHLGDDKRELGMLYGKEIERMEEVMMENELRNPIKELTCIHPRYYRPKAHEGNSL